MDNEKLEKANSLTKKIKEVERSLEFVEKTRVSGDEHKLHCHIDGNGASKKIDHDIFEIALFAQEKRIQIELAKLEKEFASL